MLSAHALKNKNPTNGLQLFLQVALLADHKRLFHLQVLLLLNGFLQTQHNSTNPYLVVVDERELRRKVLQKLRNRLQRLHLRDFLVCKIYTL